MRKHYALLLSLIAGAGLARLAAADLARPILGYVPGSAEGSLVRLAGLPGAAYAEPAVDLGGTLARVVLSPARDYALALPVSGGGLSLLRLGRTPLEPQPIPAVLGADRIAISQSGEFAVVWSRAAAAFQVLGGLPERPVLVREIGAAALGDSVGALAVSDGGDLVLATAGTTGGELLIFTAESTARLALPAPVSAAAFRPGQREAAVLAGGEVWWAADLAGAPSGRLLAGGGQAPAEASALEFSRDGRRLYAADAGAREIRIFDSAGFPVGVVPCDAPPLALRRLEGNSVFWLGNSAAGTPRLLDDDSPAAPRVVSVPPMLTVSN
jgi:hypothetical protein